MLKGVLLVAKRKKTSLKNLIIMLIFIFCTAIMISLASPTSWAADSDESVYSITRNGIYTIPASFRGCIEITGGDNITINGGGREYDGLCIAIQTLAGDLTLNLADISFTAPNQRNGIYYSYGKVGQTLTLNCQGKVSIRGSGAVPSSMYAGGNGIESSNGSLTINGSAEISGGSGLSKNGGGNGIKIGGSTNLLTLNGNLRILGGHRNSSENAGNGVYIYDGRVVINSELVITGGSDNFGHQNGNGIYTLGSVEINAAASISGGNGNSRTSSGNGILCGSGLVIRARSIVTGGSKNVGDYSGNGIFSIENVVLDGAETSIYGGNSNGGIGSTGKSGNGISAKSVEIKKSAHISGGNDNADSWCGNGILADVVCYAASVIMGGKENLEYASGNGIHGENVSVSAAAKIYGGPDNSGEVCGNGIYTKYISITGDAFIQGGSGTRKSGNGIYVTNTSNAEIKGEAEIYGGSGQTGDYSGNGVYLFSGDLTVGGNAYIMGGGENTGNYTGNGIVTGSASITVCDSAIILGGALNTATSDENLYTASVGVVTGVKAASFSGSPTVIGGQISDLYISLAVCSAGSVSVKSDSPVLFYGGVAYAMSSEAKSPQVIIESGASDIYCLYKGSIVNSSGAPLYPVELALSGFPDDEQSTEIEVYAPDGASSTRDGYTYAARSAAKTDIIWLPAGSYQISGTHGGYIARSAVTVSSSGGKATLCFKADPSWTPDGWNNPYSDVWYTDWFYESVKYVTNAGIMGVTSGGAFSPSARSTRAMVVTVLWRMENEPAPANENPFYDMSQDWYQDAIAWSAEKNIVTGYGDGKFGPDDSITREQLATMLYNYAQWKGQDTSTTTDLSGFSDALQISDWALDAVKWANAQGLINGRSDTEIIPKGDATRAELAAILHRFLES